MTSPDLEHVAISHPDVRRCVATGRTTEALQFARDQLATGLSDLAMAQLATGDGDGGFKSLQDALNIFPGSRIAYHNMLTALLEKGLLHGDNLRSMQTHLMQHMEANPWLSDFRSVLYMPRWLNLEFVLGKCNLKCRMCLGLQSPSYPDRLSYLSADDFDAMLAAAPTVRSVTLSSGDSDPLLHPEFDKIIDIARRRQTLMDVFTNGLPLGSKTARAMIDAQVVHMVNFSIDAATPETYQAIRGDRLDRVIKKIEMLQEMKRERGVGLPKVSMSFVAMADNIAELPEFVRLAKRLGAVRVFVEDLIGWQNGENGNFHATDDPRCLDYVREAKRIVDGAGIQFDLPERLRCETETTTTPPALDADSAIDHTEESDGATLVEPVATAAPATEPDAIATSDPDLPGPTVADTDSSAPSKDADAPPGLGCCGWIDAVYVNQQGRLDPCCLVHGVADLGNIHDGSLLDNEKYRRVKDQLLSGKVFRRCQGQRMCQYVQQQHTAGRPLRFITPTDLGELYLDAERPDTPACDPEPPTETLVSLDVLPVG